MDTIKEPLRITLAAARINAGYTQDGVAAKLHVGKQTIVNWEKQKCKPSFATLNALSDLYSIPIDNLKV